MSRFRIKWATVVCRAPPLSPPSVQYPLNDELRVSVFRILHMTMETDIRSTIPVEYPVSKIFGPSEFNISYNDNQAQTPILLIQAPILLLMNAALNPKS